MRLHNTLRGYKELDASINEIPSLSQMFYCKITANSAFRQTSKSL